MDLKEVKKNLNKEVRLVDNKNNIDSTFILTACILRKKDDEIFYTVELQDRKAKNSVLICGLDDIKECEQ